MDHKTSGFDLKPNCYKSCKRGFNPIRQDKTLVVHARRYDDNIV